jgi:hypothetical protein
MMVLKVACVVVGCAIAILIVIDTLRTLRFAMRERHRKKV